MISFDGPSRLIIIGTGVTELSIPDVWSRWVDWYLTSDNSKYLPAFESVGGQDINITAGTTIPIYTFLSNGWKIRPQEADHTLNVTDGILLTSDGSDPFTDTLGDFTVRINFQQPVQAIGVATGGGGGASVNQIWSNIVEIEDGVTAQQALSLILAAVSGETEKISATKWRFKSPNGAATRLDVDYDNTDFERINVESTPSS